MEVIKIRENEVEILKELFPKNYEEMISKINNREICTYGIKVNDKYIGKVNIDFKSRFLNEETIENKRVGLSWMHILKEYRGNGYSSNLMDFVLRDIKNMGYKEVSICVEPENKIALNLYKKFGFTEKIGEGEIPFKFYMFLKRYN